MSDASDDFKAEVDRRCAEVEKIVRAALQPYVDTANTPTNRDQMVEAMTAALKASDVLKTRREPDGTPIYDPLTCITAGELRQRGMTLGPEIPDAGWVPRESIKWAVSNNMTDEEVKAGKLRISMGATFTEAFQWIELDYVISAADDTKELDE